MSSSSLTDVGTGGSFKPPSLRALGFRAPYMHDGCAQTIADRFGPCGGGDMHGDVSLLSDDDLADLEVYLASL